MTTAQQPAPVPPEPHDQTPQPKSPDQHTVRKQLTSGVFYIAIAKYAGIVISLAVSGVLARLLSFNNVIVTSHQGFFTREAVDNIARTTMPNIKDFSECRRLENEVRAEPENAVGQL